MTEPGDPPADQLRARRVAAVSTPIRELVDAGKPDLGRLDRLSFGFDRVWDRFRDRGLDLHKFALEIDHFQPDFVQYEATPWRYLPSVLRRRDVGADDVFVDLGCGKGRIVIQAASRYRFARVIGVEVAAGLAGIARHNVAEGPHRIRAEVDIQVADATSWTVPDDVTVAFMYHPFGGGTFATVLGNLIASYDCRPRRLRFVYVCPLLHETVLGTGRFELVRRHAFRPKDHPSRQVHLYEIRG